MQNGQVAPGAGQARGGEHVAVLQAQIVLLVEEALLLHAGHVQDVQLGQHRVQIVRLHVFQLLFLQHVLDVAGQLQLGGGNQHEPDALVARKGVDEGMDGAAELQIAAEAHGHAVEAALLAVNGQKVGQRLGGVVVAAVAGVDDGHGGFHGRDHRRALLEVAHGDNVGVASHHADGVGHALALGRGAVGRIGKADDVAAQLVHGGFEAQARARGRLEEQRRQLLARALVGVIIGMGDDVVGGGEQLVDLRGREVENVDQMSHSAPPIQLSSLGLLRKAISRCTSSGRM